MKRALPLTATVVVLFSSGAADSVAARGWGSHSTCTGNDCANTLIQILFLVLLIATVVIAERIRVHRLPGKKSITLVQFTKAVGLGLASGIGVLLALGLLIRGHDPISIHIAQAAALLAYLGVPVLYVLRVE
jgi:hypothetical protein